MALILGNPQLEQRLYADAYMQQQDLLVDQDDLMYDPFLKKLLKKRKERRAKKPKVIKRRIRKDKKRIAKGKKPKHPELIKKKPAPAPVAPKAAVKSNPYQKRSEYLKAKGKPPAVKHGRVLGDADVVLARERQAKQAKMSNVGVVILLLVGGGFILKKIIDSRKKPRIIYQTGQY